MSAEFWLGMGYGILAGIGVMVLFQSTYPHAQIHDKEIKDIDPKSKVHRSSIYYDAVKFKEIEESIEGVCAQIDNYSMDESREISKREMMLKSILKLHEARDEIVFAKEWIMYMTVKTKKEPIVENF